MLPSNPLARRGGFASAIADRVANGARVPFAQPAAPPTVNFAPTNMIPFSQQIPQAVPPTPRMTFTQSVPLQPIQPATQTFTMNAQPAPIPLLSSGGRVVHVSDADRPKLVQQQQQQQTTDQEVAAGIERVDRLRSSVLVHGVVAFCIAVIISTFIVYRSEFDGISSKTGVERVGASFALAAGIATVVAVVVWITNSSMIRAAEVGMPVSRRASRAMRYIV